MARLHSKLLVTLLTLSVAGAPAGAFAQSGQQPPGYSGPAESYQETIHGRIASFDGVDSLQINDDRGFVDNVRLDRNTVVNPAQLQPGSPVTIVGVARGNIFAARRVDVAVAGGMQQGPPPPGPQQPPDAAAPVAGNVVTGLLGTSLDSKNAYVGEPVELHQVASQDGSISHATLVGTVTDVTPAGQGRNAQVRMHFDTLRFPDGSRRHVDGVVTSANVQTKNNAAKEIGGAVLGMLAGNAIAKTLFGISGGGLLGAAGGFFIAKDNRANVVIPADTAVTVQLVGKRRQAQ